MGARGGSAGAARARARYERAHGERGARRAETLYQEVVGARSANDAANAWRREQHARGDAGYQHFLARALETAHGAADRRAIKAWDSEFNVLYRAAAADGWRRSRYGSYHDLLVYLGWRKGGKGTPAWGAGNTPKGGTKAAYQFVG